MDSIVVHFRTVRAPCGVYLRERAKRVADYLGCQAVPAALRDFERAIERAAGIAPTAGRHLDGA